ncbi:MAG TPA: PatB family C-S lyase [Opitutaceae bacterium]|nr:PatB family C-S lyase [Opitutaceae bacterium]
MTYDFDTPIDRRGTDSQKWQKYAGRDVIPLWVADMDFRAAPEILAALHARVDHGVFGYARPLQTTVEAMVAAMHTRYGWRLEPSWLVWLPGLVVGLNVAARAFTQPGETVLCNPPVYPPFMTAPVHQGRAVALAPLTLNGAAHRWEIDWQALAARVTPQTKLFLLCSPHNPVACVFRQDELERLAEFCLRHDLILCADEIHCDLILDDLPHVPIATLGEAIARRTITLMAPSKTYNLPGLGTSLAIIPDPELRARFLRASAGIVAEVNCLGYAACEAAYRHGEPWRQALLAYLRGNRAILLDGVARKLPGVKIEAPIEATYLAWLNVAALGLPDPVAHFENHGVGLSDGRHFGAEPGTYLRLNFGCPRATLIEALARMTRALAAR